MLILDDARSLEPAGPVRDCVLVRVFSRPDPEGQVDNSVTVCGDPRAQRGAGSDRATEDEPRGVVLKENAGASSGAPVSGPRYATRRMPNAAE